MKKEQLNKDILSMLSVSDESTVLKGLEILKQKGDHTITEDIMKLAIYTSSSFLKEKLKQILFEIKTENALICIFKLLNEVKEQENKEFLLQIIWQASLPVSDKLTTIVEIAIKGELMVCFECLTIIENTLSNFNEQDISKAIQMIDKASNKKLPWQNILDNIAQLLQDMILNK
jgi:precorrin-3B methylase